MTLRRFESYAVARAGVARVAFGGELDWDSAPYIRKAVAACLEERPKTLCLDLSDVSFCDCAGVNALLEARIAVSAAGAGLVVEGIGAQLGRLLALIGASDVLTGETAAEATEPARRA
ncbi:STAS domain-containing protein [Streptomyces albidochromogenes]|uniref:STAS domain-containing protein n=1 Tax=Streptomyces albidochromogenes TaxID=329524 RepID=UPI00110F772D|nr:STAS domain-containing protein [Streptomyces albidochromogenes]